jgi:hypothetical protein
MKNFKPSELPADTVIKDEAQGVWMKEEDGVWGEMTAHCSDCADTVRDDGMANIWLIGNIKSDDYFKDFKVISFPTSVVETLIDMVEGYELTEWHESDRDEILQNAIENVNRNNDA